MEFLYPGFLFALAAISIPILVHLFNFRKFKKIEFTNVRFLKEIKQQTQSQNRLKHLLVLLMRILAIVALVMAFAQPYFPTEGGTSAKSKKNVSIFIDNSFSMQGESEGGELLEVAKNKAIDISQAFSNQDEYQLLTQSFLGQHQHLVNQEVFSNWTTEVDFSPASHTLPEIIERQSDILLQHKGSAGLEAFIISDFQESRYDLTSLSLDTSVTLSLVHLERGTPANLYIDSVWFESPIRTLGETEVLKVRITNAGDNPVSNVPLKLEINGQQKSIGTFGASANSTADTALYFIHEAPGLKKMLVHLEDHPVTYDDDYYLAYDVFQTIQVKSIVENLNITNDNIKAVFRSDSTLEFTQSMFNKMDYASLPEQDLLVLNELSNIPTGLGSEVATFVKNGGSVWIIPSSNIDLEQYNILLNELEMGAFISQNSGTFQVKLLNASHELYNGVFQKIPENVELPKCGNYYKLSQNIRSNRDQLMGFSNGNDFLTSNQFGSGRVYLSTAALSDEANSFSRNALFVASSLRMAELSKSSEPNVLNLGTETIDIKLPSDIEMNDESVIHLINESLQADVVPMYHYHNNRVSVSPGPEINQAGNYEVKIGNEVVGAIGMNYNRTESELKSLSMEDLETLVNGHMQKSQINIFNGSTERLKQDIDTASHGQELWKICLILGLVLLFIETVLLRFWK